MIEKVNEAGAKLRFTILAVFIIISIVLAIFYACESKSEQSYSGTLAFWPPDLVPHPPHFPEPKPVERENPVTPLLMCKSPTSKKLLTVVPLFGRTIFVL